MKAALPVDEGKCELEGPYECPSCQGHMMLDVTYLEQVGDEVSCPYCQQHLFVGEP